jgi:hypothetical protein
MNINITEILLLVTDTIAQYFRAHSRLRFFALLFFPVLAAFSMLVRRSVTLAGGGEPLTNVQQFLVYVAVGVVGTAMYLFVCSVLALTEVRLVDTSINAELARLKGEREELKRRVEEEPSKKSNIFDSIQLSLNQLTEYYTINKGQARSSFRSSIFAMVVGLGTLVSGIWFFYFHQGNVQLATLSSISGVLVQFIGGAYFVLYKKSLEQLNFFYESLLTMQDTMLAVQLAEQLEEEHRGEVYEKIIMALISRKRGSFSQFPSQSAPRNAVARKERGIRSPDAGIKS